MVVIDSPVEGQGKGQVTYDLLASGQRAPRLITYIGSGCIIEVERLGDLFA